MSDSCVSLSNGNAFIPPSSQPRFHVVSVTGNPLDVSGQDVLPIDLGKGIYCSQPCITAHTGNDDLFGLHFLHCNSCTIDLRWLAPVA